MATQTTFGGKTILTGYDDTNGTSIYAAKVAGGTNGAPTTAKLTLHVGANTDNQIEMIVHDFRFERLACAAGLKAGTTFHSVTALIDDTGTGGFFLTSQSAANISIKSIDAMIKIVDTQRADFAEESANLSQQSIIQQAATSMLMQANTRPQLALSMLG